MLKKTLPTTLAASVALILQSGALAESMEWQGTLRDFSASHADFQSKDTGLKTGCVESKLGDNRKPTLSGSGQKDCAISNFDDWYHDSKNSENIPFTMTLDKDDDGNYIFDAWGKAPGRFFPIDNGGKKHNYHFTLEVHGEFTYQDDMEISVGGNDDIWVFINEKRVIDLGGVHNGKKRTKKLKWLGLKEGETYPLDLFFAQRSTKYGSNLKIETNIKFTPPPEPGEGVGIEPLDKPGVLEITAPEKGSHWHVAENCTSPILNVEGQAALEEVKPTDVALLLDTSCSTGYPRVRCYRKRGRVDHGDHLERIVFEAERDAADALINHLESSEHDIQLSLNHFAREANTLVSPTSDWAALREGVVNLLEDPEQPVGSTYMALGMDTAREDLINNGRQGTQKSIILITDGVPTLPEEDGFSQQEGDRVATIEAAQRAADDNVKIYPIVILSDKDPDSLKTTMPAVRAITGVPDDVPNLDKDNVEQLTKLLLKTSLTDIKEVIVKNLTTNQQVKVAPELDGHFQIEVPVQTGKNELEISAHAGNEENAISRTLTIDVMAEELNGSQELACAEIPVPPCQIYAIHDDRAADTQFLTAIPLSGVVDALGPVYPGHDIEGMDISPIDDLLVAVAGHTDNSILYRVNPLNGDIQEINKIQDAEGNDFKNMVSLSYRNDGTLWGVARDGSNRGIVKIDPNTAVATREHAGGVKASGIAWSIDGSELWMVNGKTLHLWTEGGTIIEKYTVDVPGRDIEGLEFRPDGKLMAGVHSTGKMSIYAIDTHNGSAVLQDSFDTDQYDDIESIAWPESCGDIPGNPEPAGPDSVIIGVNEGADKFRVSLESHEGDTWTYRVEEVEGKDLSHWVIGRSGANYSCEGKVLGSSPGATGIGQDGQRPFYGIKWDVSDGFSNDTFSFTLDADYPATTVDVLIKTGGSQQTNTGQIIGPDCSGN